MNYIIALMGITSALFSIWFFSWLMYNFLYFLLPHKTASEFRKLKREFKDGTATALYMPNGQACHTRCIFEYSSGRFVTTLDPVSSPFGVYKVIECNLNNIDLININKLGVKAHDWAQSNGE